MLGRNNTGSHGTCNKTASQWKFERNTTNGTNRKVTEGTHHGSCVCIIRRYGHVGHGNERNIPRNEMCWSIREERSCEESVSQTTRVPTFPDARRGAKLCIFRGVHGNIRRTLRGILLCGKPIREHRPKGQTLRRPGSAIRQGPSACSGIRTGSTSKKDILQGHSE